MRNSETHFEQISIEMVEEILREAAARASMLEKSPATLSALERQSAAEFLKELETTPSKERP
jgi:hypothetical protein